MIDLQSQGRTSAIFPRAGHCANGSVLIEKQSFGNYIPEDASRKRTVPFHPNSRGVFNFGVHPHNKIPLNRDRIDWLLHSL